MYGGGNKKGLVKIPYVVRNYFKGLTFGIRVTFPPFAISLRLIILNMFFHFSTSSPGSHFSVAPTRVGKTPSVTTSVSTTVSSKSPRPWVGRVRGTTGKSTPSKSSCSRMAPSGNAQFSQFLYITQGLGYGKVDWL